MTKILIADDEPSILLSLEFLFKKAGYKVYIARDGQEAIDIYEQEQPNLLLLDIMMPNVDGYAVCQHVKSKTPPAKVIFVSAKNKEPEIEEGYKLGADLYIPKPFSNKELLKQVKNLLD